MSNDERPDSLAAQAAAWVPPWERQQRPPDRAYQAEAEEAARAEAEEAARSAADRDGGHADIAHAEADESEKSVELAAIEDDESDMSASPSATEGDKSEISPVLTDETEISDSEPQLPDSPAFEPPAFDTSAAKAADLVDKSEMSPNEPSDLGERQADAASAGEDEPEISGTVGLASLTKPEISVTAVPLPADKSEMSGVDRVEARTRTGVRDAETTAGQEASAELDGVAAPENTADPEGVAELETAAEPLAEAQLEAAVDRGNAAEPESAAELGTAAGDRIPGDEAELGRGGADAGGEPRVAGPGASAGRGRGKAGSAVPEQGRRRRSAGDEAEAGDSRTAGELGELPGLGDDGEFAAALEAILLVVDEPVGEMQLAQILEQPTERVAAMLEDISARYTAAGHGFDLRRAAGGWRLYTRPEYADYVERFVLDGQSVRLTQAALETLAVVAYKQPVTRSRISAIRGVNCDGVMRTLVTRGLIEECGTESETGAYLYRTTALFLEKLGLNSVEQLPPLAPFLPDDVEEVLDAPG